MRNPNTTGHLFVFGLKLSLCIAWGVPILAVAFVLAFTIIGVPVAIALLPVAAYPMKRTIERRAMEQAVWQLRGRAFDEGTDVPWEL